MSHTHVHTLYPNISQNFNRRPSTASREAAHTGVHDHIPHIPCLILTHVHSLPFSPPPHPPTPPPLPSSLFFPYSLHPCVLPSTHARSPSHVDSITPTHFPYSHSFLIFPPPFVILNTHTHTLHTTVFHNTTTFLLHLLPPPSFPLSYSLSLSSLSHAYFHHASISAALFAVCAGYDMIIDSLVI